MNLKNNKEGTSRNNKDTAMKKLIKDFKDTFLQYIDPSLPKIVDFLSTDVDVINYNEFRMDNLILLEDGSYLLIDYESNYNRKKKIKYLRYITEIFVRNYENNPNLKIRTLIIYTTNKKIKTEPDLDIGTLQLHCDEIFLADLNEQINMNEILYKIKNNKVLTEKEKLGAIIYPMTYEDNDDKQQAISVIFNNINNISNEETKAYIVAGISVLANNIISNDNANKAKELMTMLLEVEKAFEREKKEFGKIEHDKGITEGQREIIINMLNEGLDNDVIARCAKSFSHKEIEELRKQFNKDN